MGLIVTYGIGGFDSTKPNNNILEILDEETMLPATIEIPETLGE